MPQASRRNSPYPPYLHRVLTKQLAVAIGIVRGAGGIERQKVGNKTCFIFVLIKTTNIVFCLQMLPLSPTGGELSRTSPNS